MRQRSSWDGLMLAFAGSMVLWPDLPAVAVLALLAAIVGMALALGGGE